jgi:hypothetical protein
MAPNHLNLIWFGDIHGPKTYRITGCRWAFLLQTPVVLPGRESGFWAGCRPDPNKENIEIGRRDDFDDFPTRLRAKSGPEARFPGGSTIA